MTGKSEKEITEEQKSLINHLTNLLKKNIPIADQNKDDDFNKQMCDNLAIMEKILKDPSDPFVMKKFLDCADKTKQNDQFLIWLIFAAVAIALSTIVITPFFPWFALIGFVVTLTLITAYVENQPTETWLDRQAIREEISTSMHNVAKALDPKTYADTTGYGSFFYCDIVKTIRDNLGEQECYGNYCKEG